MSKIVAIETVIRLERCGRITTMARVYLIIRIEAIGDDPVRLQRLLEEWQ